MIIIDSPTPFSPLSQWRAHLRSLKRTKTDNAEDRAIIAEYTAKAEAFIGNRLDLHILDVSCIS